MGKYAVITKAFYEKYWDNYIEKAMSHKYIRKIPDGKGGWNYIYPKDFSKPLKVLLSVFGLKEEKIDSAYAKQNIQAEYGADKKTFASHVLEYLSNRATWNKFFNDKFNRDRYKTPVKFEPKKTELKTKVENGEIKNNGKTTDKTGKEHNETKEKDFKGKWNNSLMRKIYSMYNPIPEDKKTETVAGPVAFNVGDSVSKDGKVGKITKDYGNGMYFVNFDNGGMGRFNAVELQNLNPTNQEVSNAADVNAVEQEVEQKRNDVVSENPAEEHENRSQAMMGNQNAKKDGIDFEEEKKEFKELVDRYNTLQKEFTSNGGYSSRRTTKEQDEKRVAARKGLREVEKELVEFRKRINEKNNGSYRIPAVYDDAISDWMKRKVKGQTISSDWMEKKFGGYGASSLKFGDDYSFSLGDTESADNPVVRIIYEEWGSSQYVSFEVGKMNDDQYRPRFMPQDSDKWSEVYKKFDDLRQLLNNAEGNTPAEKFYNTVLGENNPYSGNNTESSNIPRYRFTKDGIKDKNGKLEKINASVRNVGGPDEYIQLYADGYGDSIPSIFYPENDSDSMTDYFEKDSSAVYPDHPYYNHLKIMALKKELYRGRSTKWASMTKEQQNEVEKQIKELEKQLVEPTDEELKAYRERRDVQEENKQVWKEAQSAYYRNQQEERAKAKEEEQINKFTELLGKFAEELEKEPPVYLGGLTKDEKIETLNDRIAKLGLEINNSSDPETIESKTKFRTQLQQKLEEVKKEPDEPEETEAEKTQNRSDAMLGNQNAAGFRMVDPKEYAETPSNTVEEKKQELDELWNQRGQGNGFELDKKIENARQELHEAEMDEKDSKDGIVTPTPKIDANVARRINDISMSGHGGEVYQHDVNVEMSEFREKFNVENMNPQQKEYFQERLNSYAELVGSSYGEMASKRLSAGPSWAVAGPAKFNNKRYQQKMDSERRAYETFAEKKDKFIKNTEKKLKELKYTGGSESVDDVKQRVFDDYARGNYSYGDKIDNTDPYAIEKISGKIKYMEDAHDVTLIYGKLCKKNGITNVSWADRTEEDKAKRKEVLAEAIKLAKEKGYSDKVIKEGIEHPFTQNQTADIRRNKERLAELQKRQAVIDERKTTESTSSGSTNTGRVDFDGGYVYENPEMDRIQIIYDGKPSRDVIDTLKHNGFRWSPSQGAWQRQLNRNGRMAVNRVFENTGINTKIDIDGAGEVKKSFIPRFIIKGGRFLIRK